MVKGVYQKSKPILLHGKCGVSPEDILEDIGFLLGVVGHVFGVEYEINAVKHMMTGLGVYGGSSLGDGVQVFHINVEVF